MSGGDDSVSGPGGGPSAEEVEKIAQEELRETASTREIAIEQFREWVTKNRDISAVRTDSSFLLRFLRVKKFSLPMAQQTLLKYLNLRRNFSHYFNNISFDDAEIMNMLTSGFIFASPIRDPSGRRVMIYVIDRFNPYKHSCDVMAQVFMMAYEVALEDEVTQIAGMSHFADTRGATAAYATVWSPMEFVRAVKWGEQSVPMRNKSIHVINMPTSVRYLVDICRGLLSNKLKSRFFIHDSIDSLTSQLNPKCLPKEYGGEIPMSEMLESWKREVLSKKDLILVNKKMQIHNTSGIDSKKNRSGCQPYGTNDITALNGSFRQLNVD